MVYTYVGQEQVIDLISADFSNGKHGTDNSLTQIPDTGLNTGIVATDLALTSIKTTSSVISTLHVLDNATGNGNTLNEYGISNSSATYYNRIVFADNAKTANDQFNTIVTFNINLVD